MARGQNFLTTLTLAAILAVLVYATFAGPPRAQVAPSSRQIAELGR